MALTPGFRLGGYEVLAHLGAGGMGEVYRASDTRLGREVALKVLPAELADEDAPAALEAFRLAVLSYEGVGSPRGTGLALLGLAAVEAADGRPERAVAIAEAAQVLTARAGVVCDHPMDPGVVERIDALKASIPQQTVDGLVAAAGALSPAAVLAMVAETAEGSAPR